MDQTRSLLRLICLPLRKCLGLPSTAHMASILVELGLPDIDRVVETSLLRFGARCHSLPDTHPTKCLFLESYAADQTRTSQTARPLTERLKEVETKLGISHQQASNMTRAIGLFHQGSLAVTRTFENWRNGSTGKSLKRAKPTAGVSRYLRHDSVFVATQRARLRFDVATQSSLSRFSPSISPDCPFCPGTGESASHLILECPAYMRSRVRCRLTIRTMDTQVGLETSGSFVKILLGEVETLPSRLRTPALAASALFLRNIFCLRTTQRTGRMTFFPYLLQHNVRPKGLVSKPPHARTSTESLRTRSPPSISTAIPSAVIATAGSSCGMLAGRG